MNTHKPLVTSSNQLKILDINFNQDQGCFAVGHEQGFLVFNTNPIELRVERNFAHASSSGSGIGHITMLHRTNYLALIGGGMNPKFPSNKLIIWDDLKRKISLNLEFSSPILNVFLSRIRIIIVLKNQILVYGFSSPPKKYATYETINNEYGLADLSVNSASFSSSPQKNSPNSSPSLGNASLNSNSSSLSSSPPLNNSSNTESTPKFQTLAFPGRQIGQIQLVDVSPNGQEKNIVSIIKAHKSKIRCLALNRAGTLIASASEQGTLIRIHSTQSTALLCEFRRGLDRAIITSMKFNHDGCRLAVLSDKNTLHLYNINIEESDIHHPINRQHLLKRISLPIPIPSYFNSTWSFCSINTNIYHTDIDVKTNDEGVIGWSGNDSIIIVWKKKKIWEKFIIVEKQHKSNGSFDEMNNSYQHSITWELVRSSWKTLESLIE